MSLTVKPLVWRIVSGGDDNPLPDSWPVYHGSFMERVQSIIVQTAPNRFTTALPHKDCPTLAAAQAAGQEEWEAFIRAAVEETPSLFPCPPQTGMDRCPPPRDALHRPAMDNAGRDLT